MFIKPFNILQDIRDSYIERISDDRWLLRGLYNTSYDKKTDALHAKEALYQFIKDGCRQDRTGVLEVCIVYLGYFNQYSLHVDEYNNGEKTTIYATEAYTYEMALLAQEIIDIFIKQSSEI